MSSSSGSEPPAPAKGGRFVTAVIDTPLEISTLGEFLKIEFYMQLSGDPVASKATVLLLPEAAKALKAYLAAEKTIPDTPAGSTGQRTTN